MSRFDWSSSSYSSWVDLNKNDLFNFMNDSLKNNRFVFIDLFKIIWILLYFNKNPFFIYNENLYFQIILGGFEITLEPHYWI